MSLAFRRVFFAYSLFIIGCESSIETTGPQSEALELDIYADYEYRDGYYRYEYPKEKQSSYGRVYYDTEPMTRVFWASDDFFTMIYWGREYHYPVINYSTYSDEYGNGQQLFYVYEEHIGDTLDLYGCVDNICDEVSVIIE
tara:strand:+ start:3879 stop:4301 length:423 start_codon:yes stop_codon:yes gene_type:complete